MKCWRSKAPRATHSLVGEQVCQPAGLTARSQTALNGGRVVVTGGKLSSGCKRTISSEKLTLTLGLEGMNSNPLGRINSLGRIFQAKEHSMCECANLEDILHPGTSQKDSKAWTDLVERGTLGNDPEYEFRHVKACSTHPIANCQSVDVSNGGRGGASPGLREVSPWCMQTEDLGDIIHARMINLEIVAILQARWYLIEKRTHVSSGNKWLL